MYTATYLQFDGDATDRSLLDTFHHMSNTSSNLVPQLLTGNNSHLFTDPFVDVEVMGETSVVFLDDNTGSLLYRFCTNTTHCCCCGGLI